jgi:TolA-binding protein
VKHPADRIRAETLWLLVCCGLLARNVVRIRRWAGEARQMQRDAQQRHGRELNDLDDAHGQRVADLQAQIAELTGRPPAEPSSPAEPAA